MMAWCARVRVRVGLCRQSGNADKTAAVLFARAVARVLLVVKLGAVLSAHD